MQPTQVDASLERVIPHTPGWSVVVRTVWWPRASCAKATISSVNGTKYYSTGALYADWFSSIALDDEGQETSFLVPRERAGLSLVDDFDTMGQRLTASGTSRHENVLVSADEVGARWPTTTRATGRRRWWAPGT